MNWELIVGLLTALINLMITAIGVKSIQIKINAEDEYFNSVVVPIYKKYRYRNDKSGIRSFLINKCENSEYTSVPEYIYYAINDLHDDEELKNNLLFSIIESDYKELYPNRANKLTRIINKISLVIIYVVSILFTILLSIFFMMVFDFKLPLYSKIIISIICIVAFVAIGAIIGIESNNERFTLNDKQIKKRILHYRKKLRITN